MTIEWGAAPTEQERESERERECHLGQILAGVQILVAGRGGSLQIGFLEECMNLKKFVNVH